MTLSLACLCSCGGNGRARADGASAQPKQPAPPDARTAPAELVVDEDGVLLGGRRVALSGLAEEVRTLAAHGALAASGNATVTASRAAPADAVAVLVRELGAIGTLQVQISTPSADGSPRSFSVEPLGQVAEHESKCGALVLVKSTAEAQLRYLRKTTTVALGAPATGKVAIARAIATVVDRMKPCESSVWMFAGTTSARWGATFDWGVMVRDRAEPARARHAMLLTEADAAKVK